MKEPATLTEGELIQRASTGNRAALSKLVSICVGRQFVGVTAFESMVMAEGFARLAAAQGGLDESMMLAGVLRIRARHVADLGDATRSASLWLQSEALCDDYSSLTLCEGVEFFAGVLTAEADGGDDFATIRLTKLMGALSATDAGKLRNTLNEVCREVREAEAVRATA